MAFDDLYSRAVTVNPRDNGVIDKNGRRKFIVVVKKVPADYEGGDRAFFREMIGDLEEHAFLPSFNSEDLPDDIIGSNAIYSLRLNEEEFDKIAAIENLVTLSEVTVYNPFQANGPLDMGVNTGGVPG